MIRKTLLITLLLCITGNARPFYFKHIGINEGLANLSVFSIHQDAFGRMWFGTNEGLSTYDGEQVTTYKKIENPDRTPISSSGRFIPRNEVYMIVSDKQNDIYLRIGYALIRHNVRKQHFSCIQEDGVTALASISGEIWFAASDSVFIWDDKSEGKKFLLRVSEKRVNEIYLDKDSTLWLGTDSGLYRKKRDTEELSCVIPQKDICNIFESSDGNIWIGCRMEGMYRIGREGEVKSFFHRAGNPNGIASNQVRTFIEDKNGEIWIGTFNGLQKYDPATGQFTNFRQSKLPGGLTHSSIFSLFRDRQGTIWVGTYYGGVNYFNPQSDIFSHYTDNTQQGRHLSYSFVGRMTEDKDNNVWICTEGGGLNKLDRKTGKIRHYYAGENSIAHNNLKSICYDSIRHTLYIGTHTGGLSKYDIRKNRFTNYLYQTDESHDAPNDVIHKVSIYKDSLVVLARNGLFVMDLQTETFRRMLPEVGLSTLHGINFLVDSKGYLWFSKSSSLLRINIQQPADSHTYICGRNGLGTHPIIEIFESKEGVLYVGTQGSGLFRFDEQTHTFTGYTVENGKLPSDYCYSIAQTHQGNLIITNDKGVTFFNPQNGQAESINLGNNGLLITAINASCGLLVCQNKEIFIGGADGLSSFFEEDLQKKNIPYDIYFSELYIANKKVYPNDTQKVLTQILPYTSSVTLTHKQNSLIVYFASNNYIGLQKNSTYEYMLEGFSAEWLPASNNRIYYTNLHPGEYTLKVREKRANLQAVPKEIQLAITIKKPLYATPLAYFLYLAVTVSIVFSFIHFRYSKMKLAASLSAEKKEKAQIEELNQAKLLFFTNISHEFRTPLTLILSQIEILLQNTSLSPSVYNKILKVYKHSYHMRHLINDLLDFRKFEQNHVTLRVSEQDLVAFLKGIYLSFYEYSVSNEVNYKLDSKQEAVWCWFDPKQMQKVFYNLLSNAFKYTPKQGSIEVSIAEDQEHIVINIIDSGTGIEQKDLDKIFDRFYQGDNSTGASNPGTGIGLSLARSIVEKHHGILSVQSRPGYGSIFSVRLKAGKEHFIPDDSAEILSEAHQEGIKPDTLPDSLFMKNMMEDKSHLAVVPSDKNKPTILIVEDNEELLQTLNKLFTPLYTTTLARNGEEGLQKAIEGKPDLILSDVMMPVMSGSEMCLRVKSNFDTSHIPVILLTALTSSEQNLKGLQHGADDYIGKPFDARLLIARCNNLVRNCRARQKKYHDQPDLDAKFLATNPVDQNFMGRVEAVIKENIDNPGFDVNQLAQEVALGRSTLFSKFKGLTGMTPNEFILNYKLKQASVLLKNNPELQIAEISDRLGFSSPRYFSKCFKGQYSMSPLEYRKSGE